MKKIIVIMGVLFTYGCTKTEAPSNPPPTVVQEESIKFTTNLDTGTFNVVDTLPLVINVNSKIPASGVTYSVISTRIDSSIQIFKLDTILNNPNLKLNIPGHNKKGNYSIFITITSNNNSINKSSKTIAVANIPIIKSAIFGSQVWGIKNIDVVTYRDGTPIPQVSDPAEWANLTTGAWCFYNNDSLNNNKGKLYNWYAVAGIFNEESKTNLSKRKIFAPVGSIPTNDEWLELEFGLKSSGQNFNFESAGFRNINGTFDGMNTRRYYWSSTQFGTDAAWSRTNNFQGDIVYMKMGLSVKYLEQKTNANIPIGLPEWTKIPDDKFEKSLISQGIDDIADGKVLTSKVSSLKFFRMEHTHVKDITGIESFVSLETLLLWQNDFTNIDVSHNTKLKILGLSECPINSIDLSKNTELVEIDFQHDSQRAKDPTYPFGKTIGLTSLDLTYNTKMERIYIWLNRLTSLDVSMCPSLTDLWVSGGYEDKESGNPIESIDLSRNPKFNVLVASNCNLKTLNIKGTANNGVPRTCITKGNPLLNQIKVNSVDAINKWRASAAGAGGTLVSDGWYLKDDHTIYVE
jgi:hypothetical protein